MATTHQQCEIGPIAASPASAAVREASAQQVHEWLLGRQAVLVDVREPDEHARERIAGARPVPLSGFDAARAAAGIVPGQRLVLHCKGGRRSADAAGRCAALASAGVEVCSMAGGIEAWKAAGLPTEVDTSVSRVSIMRQVQMVVGACVLVGCALAWLVHPWFVAVPAFFGAGLLFAGVSGTCGLAAVLGLMPWNRGATGCAAGLTAGATDAPGRCR